MTRGKMQFAYVFKPFWFHIK